MKGVASGLCAGSRGRRCGQTNRGDPTAASLAARSPRQAQRELDLPGILRGTDTAKVRCSDDEAWAAEVRVIRQIEKVRAKDQVRFLAQSERALQAQVPVGEARALDDVSTFVAGDAERAERVRICRRRDERCGIKPA